jgi:hypothetical protein
VRDFGFESSEAPVKTWFDTMIDRIAMPIFENERNGRIADFKNERVDGAEDGRLVNIIRIYRGNFKDLYRS